MPVDGHREHFSPPLLIPSSVENVITIIRLSNRCTHTLQPLDEGFSGLQHFKRRVKSHLPFAGIIRSSPYSPH